MEDELYNTYSFLLNRTARRVKQFAQKRFKELSFGITVDQWALLKALYEKEALTHSELAKLTFKDSPTLTRIINLLEEKDLVQREADSRDRRKQLVKLTSAGLAKVEELKPQVALIRKKAWDKLSPADFEHFKTVLDTIYKNLEG